MPWAPVPFLLSDWNVVGLTGISSGQAVPSMIVGSAVELTGIPSGQVVPSVSIVFTPGVILTGIPSGQQVGRTTYVFTPTPPPSPRSTGGGGGSGGGEYWYVPPLRPIVSAETLASLREAMAPTEIEVEAEAERGRRLLSQWLEEPVAAASGLGMSTGDAAPPVTGTTQTIVELRVRAAPSPPVRYRILRFEFTGWQLVAAAAAVVLVVALAWHLVVEERKPKELPKPPRRRPRTSPRTRNGSKR